MADEIVRLPYNPQGNLAAARISEEPITVRPSTGEGFNFYVPKYAPYFRNGFKLYNPDTNAYLVEGVDYLHTHAFNSMSQLVGLEIYGSIMFIDRTFSGNLQVSYYSLGGEFTLNAQQMLELLANNLLNPRETYWERVANTPEVFPPISHQHNIATDTMTWDDVVKAIESLKDPLAQGLNMAMQAVKTHERRQDNPHLTTKAQVGLGNVLNYAAAKESDLDSLGQNLYMTLEMTRKMIANLGGDSAAAHIANRNNPHVVTKAQVGLGLVDNFATASNDEMVAGTATNLFATPAGVMAAVRANATSGLTTHLADYNNPHRVSATQVGLGSVNNFGLATDNEAKAGTVANKYMTPYAVSLAITALAVPLINAHIADINNPHQTTKAQVGLGSVDNFATATNAQMVSGTANNLFATPQGVMAAIRANAIGGLQSHLDDFGNPHMVTQAQVGLGSVQNFGVATTAEAQSGTSDVKYMTPAKVKDAITALGAVKNHTHTAAEVGALPIIGGIMQGEIQITSVRSSDNGIVLNGADGSAVFRGTTVDTLQANTYIRSAGQVRVTAGGVRVDAGGIDLYNGNVNVLAGTVKVGATASNPSTYDATGDITGTAWVNTIDGAAATGKLSNYFTAFKNDLMLYLNGEFKQSIIDAVGDVSGLAAKAVEDLITTCIDNTLTATTDTGDSRPFVLGITQPFPGVFKADDFKAVLIDPEVDPAASTFEAFPESIAVGEVTNLTLLLMNTDGGPLRGQTVVFASTSGTVSATTEEGDGIYTATVTGTAKATATITVKVNGTTVAGLSDTVVIA